MLYYRYLICCSWCKCLCFTIRADRFLRNMVRAIVGTLLLVGRGKMTIEGFRDVIENKARGEAGDSAMGEALFLVDVKHPNDIYI